MGMRFRYENWLTAVGMRKGLEMLGEQSAAGGSEVWVEMKQTRQMSRKQNDILATGVDER